MINKIKLNNTSIILGDQSLNYLKDFIENLSPTKIFILLDKNSKKYCLPILLTSIPFLKKAHFFEIEHGESNKTINNVKLACKSLLINNVDRQSLIINLGGGVVCDLGGFVASIIKRGIKFINIPTTLMSQVDAAIGGKVAVNFDNYKNQIGLFSNPEAIFINFSFNNSLPNLHLLSAYAEIIKKIEGKLITPTQAATAREAIGHAEPLVRIRACSVLIDYYRRSVERLSHRWQIQLPELPVGRWERSTKAGLCDILKEIEQKHQQLENEKDDPGPVSRQSVKGAKSINQPEKKIEEESPEDQIRSSLITDKVLFYFSKYTKY